MPWPPTRRGRLPRVPSGGHPRKAPLEECASLGRGLCSSRDILRLMIEYTFLWLIVALLAGGLSGGLAVAKWQPPTLYVVLGLLLGPIGVLMACLEIDRYKKHGLRSFRMPDEGVENGPVRLPR